MSDLDYVIDVTTKLESRLRDELGAEGDGLVSRFRNVSHYFPDPKTAGDRADAIAVVRNEFAHDGRKFIDDPVEFRGWVRGFNQDISEAESIRNSRPAYSACSVIIVGALTVSAAAGAAIAWIN